MDPVLEKLATVAISAIGGGAFSQFVTWLTTRGDKKAERDAAERALVAAREQAQASANDKLAADLREEQRKDNAALRERMAKLEGQVVELNKTNESLRKENLALTEQNGRQAYQLMVQAGQLEQQSAKLGAMQKTLDEQRDHNAAMEAAMKAAHIPMPELPRRASDTGPLVGSLA